MPPFGISWCELELTLSKFANYDPKPFASVPEYVQVYFDAFSLCSRIYSRRERCVECWLCGDYDVKNLDVMIASKFGL
jgi:hypothetical protein